MKVGLSALVFGCALCALATPSLSQDLVIKVGYVAPGSTPIPRLGEDDARGAQLAIEQLNARGVLVGGRKAHFELVSGVEATDPGSGVRAAQRLVDAQVSGVIGHSSAVTAIAASKLYSDAGIPQISPVVTNPKFTQQGFKTTFRVIAQDSEIGDTLAKYAVQGLKGKSIVVIDDRTAHGQSMADDFEKALAKLGVKSVARESVSDKTTDFSTLLLGIKAKSPDVLFYGGLDTTAGPLLSQMKQSGINAKLLASDGVCTGDLPRLAGIELDGKVVCAEIAGAQSQGDASLEAFKAAYRLRFNEDASLYAPYSYDAVNVMVEAMVKAGSEKPPTYLPYLAKTRGFKGATGTIAFDAKGDLKGGGAVGIYAYSGSKKQQVALVKEGTPIHAFDWPPPPPSTFKIVARELLVKASAAKRLDTLGGVDKVLAKALDAAGYSTRSYYAIQDGFALATQLERFSDDGKPANGNSRWQLFDRPPRFTLQSYLNALFATEPGRFRVIVFVVTSRPLQSAGTAPSVKTTQAWLEGGLYSLPAALAVLPFGADFQCTALVYEFSKSPGGSAENVRPGLLNGDAHISGSGFITALGK